MTRLRLGLSPPRLPHREAKSGFAPLAVAALLHVMAVTLLLGLAPPPAPHIAAADPTPARSMPIFLPPHLLFNARATVGGGGGGGGNRQTAPIRRAEGVGHDAMTLRTTPRPPQAAESIATGDRLPSIVLDAKPMFSGTVDQIGLPSGGVSYGTSTGPGSGGGVGSGTGIGLGSGDGPGVGPGSGGGFGGGSYRPGGAVSAPRLLAQVQPRYTTDALERKIQGSVWLEAVVTKEGRVASMHVVRSLDARGLDDEAITAVRQWQFDPGRLAGRPVDVIVTVVVDFSIR
jgi:TonB family protein